MFFISYEGTLHSVQQCFELKKTFIIVFINFLLHNEELSNLYSLPNIVRVVKLRRMRLAGHVARMGEGRGVYRVLVGKPEGK